MNFLSPTHALQPARKLILYARDGEKRIPVVLVERAGVWVDQHCQVSKKACRASLALDRKLPLKNSVVNKSPVGRACESLGASPLTLEDEKHSQYAYCRFSDQSVMDAWAWIRAGELK